MEYESKNKIAKALATNSSTPLLFHEFINVTKYEINEYLIKKFYCSIDNNMPIYLDNELIKWCGYSGNLSTQKSNLLKLIKSHNVQFIQLDNYEYNKFQKQMNSPNYPKIDIYKSHYNTKHILIKPYDLQIVLLKLRTSTGHIIAKHYVNLSNLIKIYWQYQAEFYKMNFEKIINNVCDLPHVILYSRQQYIERLDTILQNRYKIGCVYFICENSDTSYLKIGWCYNLPDRLAKLQISNWRKLSTYKYIYHQYPHDLEKYLHTLFAKHKVRGEWFKDINLVELNSVLATLE